MLTNLPNPTAFQAPRSFTYGEKPEFLLIRSSFPSSWLILQPHGESGSLEAVFSSPHDVGSWLFWQLLCFFSFLELMHCEGWTEKCQQGVLETAPYTPQSGRDDLGGRNRTEIYQMISGKIKKRSLRQILFSCILFWNQCLHWTVHSSSERVGIALHKYCMKLCVQTHTRHRAICKTWLQRVKENVKAFAVVSVELLVPLEK